MGSCDMMGGGPFGLCGLIFAVVLYFLSASGPNIFIGSAFAIKAWHNNRKYKDNASKQENVKFPLVYAIPIVGPFFALKYA